MGNSLNVTGAPTVGIARADTPCEHVVLGEMDVPADAYWGVYTLRAVADFPITGIPVSHFSELVKSLVLVKQAAARANRRLGNLPPAKAHATRAEV